MKHQWNVQSFARTMYMQLDTMTFKVWMDVWGGMRGNINEAMAHAVESSAVLLVVLTEDYIRSINCTMELRYARHCGNPVIFLKTSHFPLEIPLWINDMISRHVVVDIASVGDFGTLVDGTPKMFRLSHLLRKALQWRMKQPKTLSRSVPDEIFAYRELLKDAEYAVRRQLQEEDQSGNSGEEGLMDAPTSSLSLTCGRCGASFEESEKGGCKSHRAYYMGGTIIAGRWVCCSQQEKDGLGCEDCDHSSAHRSWKQIPGHGGCYHWDPV